MRLKRETTCGVSGVSGGGRVSGEWWRDEVEEGDDPGLMLWREIKVNRERVAEAE